MRLVLRREAGECRDFGNVRTLFTTESQRHRENLSSLFFHSSLCLCDSVVKLPYSRTLSSSFLRSQSAAACTKANTRGCGFFSVEDSWGWNSVAIKKRWVGDSNARISPSGPRATIGKPASMAHHSNSGLTSKLQKNSSVTTSLSFP